jgi:hypothetical protein
MSDQELEPVEEVVDEIAEDQLEADGQDLEEDDEDQLDEFKASFGDPSTVPEPTAKKAKKLKGSKDAGEKTPVVTPGSKPPKTKVAAINAMMGHMQGMREDDLIALHGKMVSEDIEDNDDVEDELIPIKQAPQINGTDIDVADDARALFGDEDLSDEFKDRATTVFEAAIVAKVNEQLEKISIETDAEIEAEMANYDNEMTEKVDSYMDYVIKEWMDDNQLAIEKGLRSELTEDFLNGLHNLFAEHYIDIPEEKVDVAEELAQRVEELEDTLNTEIGKNVELNKVVNESKKSEVFNRVADGLVDTEVEKLRSLATGIEYSEDDYEEKLNIVKEQYFSNGKQEKVLVSVVESDGNTEVELAEEEGSQPTGAMASYMSAISRTVSK